VGGDTNSTPVVAGGGVTGSGEALGVAAIADVEAPGMVVGDVAGDGAAGVTVVVDVCAVLYSG
jgi:hypothetical protein